MYAHLTIAGPDKTYNKFPLYNDRGGRFEFDRSGEAIPFTNFFEKTVVHGLNILFVAAYGRLLLGRNRSNFFLCSPEEDCWLRLPLPPTLKTGDGGAFGAALRYHTEEASGLLSFEVALLVYVNDQELAVEVFSSEAPEWKEQRFVNMEVAAKFGENGIPQGVFKGYACYWKVRGLQDCVVSFNIIAGSIMVVAAPPPADGCSRRLASSLGSTTDGRVRMCCLDVPQREVRLWYHSCGGCIFCVGEAARREGGGEAAGRSRRRRGW
jgi:hypothetical protein